MIANYKQEQAHFNAFVQSDKEPNILLFQGESGSGKSSLIEHCLSLVPQMPSLMMKLDGGGDAIPTLFTNMGSRQGWENLPNFTHTVANLLETPSKAGNRIWQMGMYRHLREIGQLSDVESRLSRYQLLSDAWFADSIQFETPFLLAIDTYEKKTTLFDRWFSHDFLVGTAMSKRMRVVVGGQSVPVTQTGWGFCASLQELEGIHEAEAWLVWAEQVGYQIPSLEILAGAVLALDGNPSKIIEVIKTKFGKQRGLLKAKASVRIQRKVIRENMIKGFSISELKDICFDMEIDYEELPDHGHLKGFVRELLAFAKRIGRLIELIEVCRSERPHLDW